MSLINEGNHIAQNLDKRPYRALRSRNVSMEPPPAEIHDILQQTGFLYVSQIRKFRIDGALISALVERWRPETHTFHFPTGECTMTLEDVAVQLGLPSEGAPIHSVEYFDVNTICMELLGRAPIDNERSKGYSVSGRFLKSIYSEVPAEPTEQQLHQIARAYILKLIGSVLVCDKSTSFTHLMYLQLLRNLDTVSTYSWGSAVLAYLYRALCRATNWETEEVDGSLFLLQSWAWYRLPFLAPPAPTIQPFPLAARWSNIPIRDREIVYNLVQFRSRIDHMTEGDFLWNVYWNDDEITDVIPPEIAQQRPFFRVCAPLLLFPTVEWHPADRVMRQFGGYQSIPGAPTDIGGAHNLDMRHFKGALDYSHVHAAWVLMWEARHQTIRALPEPAYGVSPDYFQWLRNASILWLSQEQLLIDPRTWLNPSHRYSATDVQRSSAARTAAAAAAASHETVVRMSPGRQSRARTPQDSQRRSGRFEGESSRRPRRGSQDGGSYAPDQPNFPSNEPYDTHAEAYIPTLTEGFQSVGIGNEMDPDTMSQASWGQMLDEMGGGTFSTQLHQMPQYSSYPTYPPYDPVYGGASAMPSQGMPSHGMPPEYSTPYTSQFMTYPTVPPSAFISSSRVPFAPSSSSSRSNVRGTGVDEGERWARGERLRTRVRGPNRYTPSTTPQQTGQDEDEE